MTSGVVETGAKCKFLDSFAVLRSLGMTSGVRERMKDKCRFLDSSPRRLARNDLGV